MKRAIALVLLTVLLVISVGCFDTLQGETSPDTSFETFTDWCRHRDSLTPEVQHTMEKLLEEAETQECDRAQSRLIELTSLSLSTKGIVDISPFASLTNLTSLLLNYNQIVDISPLASLTNLTALSLDYNQIEDVSPLANLTNLTDLYLSGNRIADVSPLANLTNLRDLRLSENPLESSTCPVQPQSICQFDF